MAAIGSCWASGSWSTVPWAANTWASNTPAATAFTLTGPSAGIVNNASAPFTVTPTGGVTSGTFTPNAVSNTTFSPTTLTWSGDASAKQFTATKTNVGTVAINGTFSDALTPPASINYTTSNPPPSNAVVINQNWRRLLYGIFLF